MVAQQTNGLAERTIAVVEECLRSGVNYAQDNWVELASSVMITLNSAPKAKLLGKSSLYYERGVTTVTESRFTEPSRKVQLESRAL